MRIVHYVNQFFAGIGGEDAAGTGPELRDGAVDRGAAWPPCWATSTRSSPQPSAATTTPRRTASSPPSSSPPRASAGPR